MKTNFVGQYCVIRAAESGVFAGTIAEIDGNTVVLNDVRRLWYWAGAASLSQLAAEGVKKPDECKFTIPVETIVVFNVIEILPTTMAAMTNIKEVPVWRIG